MSSEMPISREVAIWHARIRAELKRRQRLLSPAFTQFLRDLRAVREQQLSARVVPLRKVQ
jgi:hypothetical protein